MITTIIIWCIFSIIFDLGYTVQEGIFKDKISWSLVISCLTAPITLPFLLGASLRRLLEK